MASEHEKWNPRADRRLDDKTMQQLHRGIGQLRVQMMQLDKNEESKP